LILLDHGWEAHLDNGLTEMDFDLGTELDCDLLDYYLLDCDLLDYYLLDCDFLDYYLLDCDLLDCDLETELGCSLGTELDCDFETELDFGLETELDCDWGLD